MTAALAASIPAEPFPEDVRKVFVSPETEDRIRKDSTLKELLDAHITNRDCADIHVNVCELVGERRKYLTVVLALGEELCILYEFPYEVPDLGLLLRMAVGDFAIYLCRMRQIEEWTVH